MGGAFPAGPRGPAPPEPTPRAILTGHNRHREKDAFRLAGHAAAARMPIGHDRTDPSGVEFPGKR